MAIWRCPYCGTPQPEAARCWVCSRSSTSCSTCAHFRRSLAGGLGDLGICGADPRLRPVRADEIRPCWEERRPLVAAADLGSAGLFELAPRRS